MSDYSKTYTRIYWKNRDEAETTPLGATNMNKIDYSLDEVDNRVIELNVIKTNQSDFLLGVHDITFDNLTGIFTIEYENGTTKILDTLLEKVVTNFDYDDDPTSEHYEQIVLTMEDGTVKYIDLSSLLTQYEFIDSDTVGFDRTDGQLTDGKVKLFIKTGSIGEDEISPDYYEKIELAVGVAEAHASNASDSENRALVSETQSKSYAVGGTGVREGEDTDNCKYYYEQTSTVLSDIGTAKTGAINTIGTTTTTSVATINTTKTNAVSSVNTAESDALTNIGSAKSAALSDIDTVSSETIAEVTTVRETIPLDYSDLSNTVVALKQEVDDANATLNDLFD